MANQIIKMNKKVYILTFSVFFFLQSRAQREVYDKQFFVNSMMSRNYFYSDVSYQSPSWIKNINHKLPVEEKIFFTPGNSLQLDYTSSEKGEWKAPFSNFRISHFLIRKLAAIP